MPSPAAVLDSSTDIHIIHPLHAVQRLSNVINTLDYLLARPDANMQIPATMRRAIFVRNTLIVSVDLWQDDIQRRLHKSRENFYVYCMTNGERLAFQRRIGPGLLYAAEELRHIGQPTLVNVVERAQAESHIYAEQNKACLRRALAEDEAYTLATHRTMALPPAPPDDQTAPIPGP